VAKTITVGIPTKNRYESLSHTLLSIAFQTLKPVEVIIVDDSDSPVRLTDVPIYRYIFELFDHYHIHWKVLFGQKKGQHLSHQFIQENAMGDFIFRIDDDEVAESNCLERLCSHMHEKTGAVAPMVLMPNASALPAGLRNRIDDLSSPNMQWFLYSGAHDADHLYSCFLYRKGIARYELSLSPVAHREETIFSYSIKRAGYKLCACDARVWHFRQESGGIRSHKDMSFYEHDEKIFQGLLNIWNVKTKTNKVVVLDNGIGDHFAFKAILPQLRKKHEHITIACCYPDVFFDESGLTLISIAQAIASYNSIDPYNIYARMIDWNWKGSLTQAFAKLYL